MTEAQIQKAVFDNLRARGKPGLMYWHTPNDKASRRKAGYRAGVSDVVMLYRGIFYALELKTEIGNPTVEQMKFVSDVNAAMGFACIVCGLDKALSVLETWGLIHLSHTNAPNYRDTLSGFAKGTA